MLFSIIRSGFSWQNLVLYLLVMGFIIFFVNPIHEYAHAYAAYKLGDNAAKACNRLTLNPFASFDLLGALCMLFVGIGWAKPIPINPRNFKNPKKGMAISAMWGPLTNLILAALSMLIYNAVYKFAPYGSSVTYYICTALIYIAQINAMLAVFNLIPIPPLDGSRIMAGILPDKYSMWMYKYERYIQIALFVVLFVFSRFIGILASVVTSGLQWLTSLPFLLF